MRMFELYLSVVDVKIRFEATLGSLAKNGAKDQLDVARDNVGAGVQAKFGVR